MGLLVEGVILVEGVSRTVVVFHVEAIVNSVVLAVVSLVVET